MKISIGVMTSINLLDRFKAVKDTWLSDFENSYLFGGFRYHEDLVNFQQAGEDWQSAFLKQQLGLKYMFDSDPTADWYSIVGCDNVVFKCNAIKMLSNYDSSKDFFIGQKNMIWTDFPYMRKVSDPLLFDLRRSFFLFKNIFKCTKPLQFKAIAGGAGFFISNSLMRKIVDTIIPFNEYWLHSTRFDMSIYGSSDVALSYMLKKYFNISLTHCDYLFSQSPQHYMTNFNLYDYNVLKAINKPVSFHYVSPKDMKSIYESYK